MQQDGERPDWQLGFERLTENAQLKRTLLGALAYRRSRMGRALHFAAGFFALLSAGSMTAVIAEVTTSLGLKVFTGLLSLTSGVITLLISSYFGERETARIAEGASKFLALREQADLIDSRNDLSEKQKISLLKSLTKQYAAHSGEFDYYIDVVDHGLRQNWSWRKNPYSSGRSSRAFSRHR